MNILYSTGCPRCRVLEKKLEAKGISYEIENDIDEIMEKGFSNVPVFVADGEVMDFTKAVAWVNEQED